MAYTQADLDGIKEAIASGALKVKYADREVTYQSMDDLIKARNLIAKELAQASGETVSTRRVAVYSKGL